METTMNEQEREVLTKVMLNASMDELLWMRAEIRALILLKEHGTND